MPDPEVPVSPGSFVYIITDSGLVGREGSVSRREAVSLNSAEKRWKSLPGRGDFHPAMCLVLFGEFTLPRDSVGFYSLMYELAPGS